MNRSVSGPVGDKDGNVFFADTAANRIYKSDPDRKVTVFKDASNGAHALRIGPDGRLYASQPARRQIASYGSGGDEKVVAQNVDAADLAISAKGDIYFADTTHKTIGHINASGQARTVYNGGETDQTDARTSLLWLKAYGAGAVAIAGPNSKETWKGFRHPGKFDQRLPLVWREDDVSVYTTGITSIAHTVAPTAGEPSGNTTRPEAVSEPSSATGFSSPAPAN